MLNATDERLQAMVEGQRRLFNDRLATHLARKDVLRQRIEQLNEQVKGLQAQVDASNTSTGIDRRGAGRQEVLLRKSIVTKPEVLKLQRAVAELEGRRGEYLGAIARAQQQIGETQIQILMTDAERIDQVTTRLEQLRVDLATVTEKLNSSVDILKRTVIAAPIAGIVLNMRFKTNGGVLKPAEPILDIVPAEDMLLIDAKISPTDIDVVRVGLPAKVQLTAYSGRSTPRLNGIVRTVSADRLWMREPPAAVLPGARSRRSRRNQAVSLKRRADPGHAGRSADRHGRADDGGVSLPTVPRRSMAQLPRDLMGEHS